MVNIELLKKLTFIADITKRLEPLLFNDIEIRINTLLENSEDIVYALQVLKVPYTTYEPDTGNIPEEINVSFGCEVGLNIIYQITYILKEIYGDALDAYINYATKPEGREKETLIGAYITRNKGFTNISKPITANEILKLDIKNMDWEEFSSLFPNNNYSKKGTCTFTYYEPDDYYDDGDSYSDETDWSHYNDDLDMDQQSEDFWNQF